MTTKPQSDADVAREIAKVGQPPAQCGVGLEQCGSDVLTAWARSGKISEVIKPIQTLLDSQNVEAHAVIAELVEALNIYLSAGHKEARKLASVAAKKALTRARAYTGKAGG